MLAFPTSCGRLRAVAAVLAALAPWGVQAQSVTAPAHADAARWVPDARAAAAGAGEGSVWSLQFSPLSVHANPKSDHAHPVALGVRRALGPSDFIGATAFRNSFGQPSAYVAYGQRLHGGVPALPRFYVEWSAGLMYGYVGERADEVPLNVRGFSPVFTISPGWQVTPQLSAQVNVIGTVALMLQFDWRFR